MIHIISVMIMFSYHTLKKFTTSVNRRDNPGAIKLLSIETADGKYWSYDLDTDQADGDSDTVGDVCDNCPSAANTDQADVDSDTVGDVCDNCPNGSNPDQLDLNRNFIGDECEKGEDKDGDGFIGKKPPYYTYY